jgi:hypothetical protein
MDGARMFVKLIALRKSRSAVLAGVWPPLFVNSLHMPG